MYNVFPRAQSHRWQLKHHDTSEKLASKSRMLRLTYNREKEKAEAMLVWRFIAQKLVGQVAVLLRIAG